jgi:hypothetical protein
MLLDVGDDNLDDDNATTATQKMITYEKEDDDRDPTRPHSKLRCTWTRPARRTDDRLQ